MKQLVYNIFFLIVLIVGPACSDMNDLHDKYLKDGETLYIGRVDSVMLFPGNERMLVYYWITDMRAKELQVFWLGKTNSITLNIPEHQPDDQLEFIIDPIPEGDHELHFLTNDKEGNSSNQYEALQSVYGLLYKSTLTNRPIQETSLVDNKLSILWSGSLSDQEIGLNIAYTTSVGKDEFLILKREALVEPIVLENVDLSKGVEYQTLYLPQPEAIDTFATEMSRIQIIQHINVALKKPVTTSASATPAYTGVNAVDGNRTGAASRWISGQFPSPQWLEVDLLDFYEISGFGMWRDAASIAGSQKFSFQVWIEDEWIDIFTEDNNVMTTYSKQFNSVTTNKVRLYIHPTVSVDYLIRLFEIEVYAVIRY